MLTQSEASTIAGVKLLGASMTAMCLRQDILVPAVSVKQHETNGTLPDSWISQIAFAYISGH